MTTISEDADSDDEEMEFSTMGNQVWNFFKIILGSKMGFTIEIELMNVMRVHNKGRKSIGKQSL